MNADEHRQLQPPAQFVAAGRRRPPTARLDTPEITAGRARSLAELDLLITGCRACPRLVAYREQVARDKRAAFREQVYWGRPVPGIGPETARVLVVGLAPAAHGGNRTGRMFTGDRSGDFLFASLYRTGFSSSPVSVEAGDGLVLADVRITAPVHCAPPDNKPTLAERDTCAPYLSRELDLLRDSVRVAVVLGGFAWQSLLATLHSQAWSIPRPRPQFGHGADAEVVSENARHLRLLGCYHVSQQNTFTGRLTPAMLDEVLVHARELAESC